MRAMKGMPAILLGVFLVLGACDESQVGPAAHPTDLSFLEHVDHGCTRQGEPTFDCFGEAHLVGLEAASDTVTLVVSFLANCCPEFTETVQYDDGHLGIDVVDTLYDCRCICTYQNEFQFACEGSGQVRIEFMSRTDRGDGYCVSALDTTVTVP